MMTTITDSIDKIVAALQAFDTLTIISHVRPDGDTLGCAYALCHALNTVGKSANVVCESEISPRYLFLSDNKSNISGECTGAIVCVDIASPAMAGKKYESFAVNADVVIDHHATNAGFGKLCLVDSDAAACGEIVLKIVEKLSGIDKTIAQCLYTAISTDTGCFVYGNTTAATHFAVARLIESGADIIRLNKELFRTKTHSAFEIERRAFESLEYFYGNIITCMKISKNWIDELCATEDDMEGISSIPAQIDGVKAAATFREIDTDTYKLSVRTNGEIDGALVCKQFGGGGHKMAAGCTMMGNYDELKAELAKKLYEGRLR